MYSFVEEGEGDKRVSDIIPNRSLDGYSAARYKGDSFLSSFILWVASCSPFVLDVVRYALELTTKHLLNHPMKSIQALMTDLELSKAKLQKIEVNTEDLVGFQWNCSFLVIYFYSLFL